MLTGIRWTFNFFTHNNRELSERLRQWTCMLVSLPCEGSTYYEQRQKGGDLTQSYDKSPYTNRNVEGAK